MHLGRWHRALLLGLATLGLAVPARAFHTPEQRITEDTAYTYPRSTFRLGIWKEQYSIWNPFTVGTYFWPWWLKVPNLQAKWRLYQGETWAFSAATGLFYLDTKSFKAIDENATRVKLAVVPFEMLASCRFDDRYTLSGGFVQTLVKADGTLTVDSFHGAANGAVENLQYTMTFEWRATRVTALTAHARVLVYQRLRGGGDVTLHPDAYTTVELHGGAASEAVNYGKAWSITPAVNFSWETFNLRAGVGYGNFSLPGVNFVLPNKTLIPELDLFWLF
jgi:hypothetical protein